MQPDLSATRPRLVWTQPLPLVPLVRFPHGIYTGCMGYVSPGPEACFNVAIRTADC